MTKKKDREITLSRQMEDFKKKNPKIAEAMELFGISMTKYQEALYATNGPHVYQSSSTVRLDKSDS